MKLLKPIALAGALLSFSMGTMAKDVGIALDTAADLEMSGSYVWAHNFVKELEARGMGAKEIPRGAIGGESEKLDQLGMGLLEVSLSDVKSVARIDPFILGVRLPYLFDSVAHLDRALTEGDVLSKVNDSIESANVRLLALVSLGPPSGIITTDQAVTKPEDLADLRMRAIDDVQVSMYEAWGSNGTIVSWGEVPAALQTGVVDGYINTALVPLMFGQTDIIGYFSDAKVMNGLRAVLVSDDWYQRLSADERKIVDEAVQSANQANREWLEQAGSKALQSLQESGVEVTALSEDGRERFRELSQSIYDQTELGSDDLDFWIGLSEQTR